MLLLYLCLVEKSVKQLRGKEFAIKKPEMNASDIISLQMDALQRNNKYDNGIKIAFEYASDENKIATGPYPRFYDG